MDRPWTRTEYPDFRKKHLKYPFVYSIANNRRYYYGKKKWFPEFIFPPYHIADDESETYKHQYDVAYIHRKNIEKCSIEILEGFYEWIFERVEGREERHEKLLLFIDNIDSSNREDNPDEKSDTDMLREKEKSEERREYKLDIRSKTREKCRRNLHKFLYEKIEIYGSYGSYKNNERKIYDSNIFIRTPSFYKIISTKYCSKCCRSDNASIHELHRRKFRPLHEDEIAYIG